MKQQNNTKIHGNNNKVQNQNVNIHSGGKASSDEADAAAILIVASAAIVVAAFFYLRYFGEVVLSLKFGIAAAGFLHLATMAVLWRAADVDYRDGLFLAFGITLTVFQMSITITEVTSLPPKVFEIASQPAVALGWLQQAFEVWGRFNNHGHHLIVQNMTTTLSLVPAVALNCLFGLQRVLDALARSDGRDAYVRGAEYLETFKVWGSIFSGVLTLGGLLVIPQIFS